MVCQSRHLEGLEPHHRRLAEAVVALVAERPPNQKGERWWVASGFVVDVEGAWFLVSAEHVLKEIVEYQTAFPSARVGLHAGSDPAGELIAFKFAAEHATLLPGKARTLLAKRRGLRGKKLATAKHVAELDIAIYPLSGYFVDHLRAAGVRPITSDNIGFSTEEDLQRLSQCDFSFGMAGFPMNGHVIDIRGDLKALAFKILPLGFPDCEGPTLTFEFLAGEQLHTGSVLGMSGGPVFLIVGKEVYWIGVQSGEIKVLDHTPKSVKVSESQSFYMTLLEAKRRVDLAAESTEARQSTGARL